MMRCSLPTANINKINLCVTNIELYFYYYVVTYIGQKYLNTLRDVLGIKKLAIS